MKNKRNGVCSTCCYTVPVGAGEAYKCLGSSSGCQIHWDQEDGGWHVRCSDSAACQKRLETRRAAAQKASAAACAKRGALLELRSIFIRAENRPEKADAPAGKMFPLFGTKNRIYGGGEWAVIEDGPSPRLIWLVQGNGADGDCWANSNLPGAIGFCKPYTPDLEIMIMAAREVEVTP